MEARLREDLERLRRELREGPDVDDETRQQLASLMQEIEGAIGQSGEVGDDSLGERLRAATERFEESHPSLTAVVGRIADLLSGMGI